MNLIRLAKHRYQMEMLLVDSLPDEPLSPQTILEKAVDMAIEDLQQAQARGIDRRHKDILIWKACFDLRQAKEKVNESKQSDTRSTRNKNPKD